MHRSRAYLFYDLALFAVLLLPLALASALMADRVHAAVVYALLLAIVIVLSLLVARRSTLTVTNYWRSLTKDSAR